MLCSIAANLIDFESFYRNRYKFLNHQMHFLSRLYVLRIGDED